MKQKQYLLDTCICAYWLRDKRNVREHINAVGFDNCYISEMTIAELKGTHSLFRHSPDTPRSVGFFDEPSVTLLASLRFFQSLRLVKAAEPSGKRA